MSAPDEQLRDTVLLPDAVVLKAHLTVQCATQLAEPSDEHPDGLFCGNVIEGETVITEYEPGLAVEMGIECPACSKRVSEQEGHPVQAVIPVAILIGQQVEDSLPVEGEEDDAGDVVDEDVRPVVELTPEDQGAAEGDGG